MFWFLFGDFNISDIFYKMQNLNEWQIVSVITHWTNTLLNPWALRIFANLTLKYWHLHTNILLIFELLVFIVVIIELVTLEQLYMTVCETVPDFCLHSFTCHTIILDVNEFFGVHLAIRDIS